MVSKLQIRSVVILVSALVSQLSTFAATTAPATRLSDELEFIIKQNERARSLVDNVEYNVVTRFDLRVLPATTPSAPEQFPASGSKTCSVLRKGNWIAVTGTTVANGAGGTPHSTTISCVINDAYSAFAFPGTRTAQEFDNVSAAKLAKKPSVLLSSVMDRDLMFFGFGNGLRPLREAISSKADRNVWTVEGMDSADHPRLFQLQMHRDGKLVSRYTVDPAKGFLVTQVVVYREGSVARQCNVEVANVPGTNIFYPTRVLEQLFDGKTLQQTFALEVNGFRAIPAPPNDRFQLASLALPDGTYLIQHAINGAVRAGIVRDSKIIPMDAELQLRLKGAKDPWKGGIASTQSTTTSLSATPTKSTEAATPTKSTESSVLSSPAEGMHKGILLGTILVAIGMVAFGTMALRNYRRRKGVA